MDLNVKDRNHFSALDFSDNGNGQHIIEVEAPLYDTKHLENGMLKGVTSSKSTSSFIFIVMMIKDSFFLDIGGC